jgi:hypothetical protein
VSRFASQDVNAPETSPAARPQVGVESTPQQSGLRGNGGAAGDLGVPLLSGGVNGSLTRRRCSTMTGAALAGANSAGLPTCPDGTYDVYRDMLRDPTIQLARAVVFGPILGSPWRVVPLHPDVPVEWVDFAREVYQPLESQLKSQLLRSLDFGCRSFEQIYDVRQIGGLLRIVAKKFKPLRPDITRPLVDRDTGAYAGLRNGGVSLSPEQTLHYAYDLEDDDWYGRSRMENVRENAWWPWVCHQHTAHRLGRKVSSIIPIVKGPISAKETDADGKEVDGYSAAMLILNALAQGDGVIMENLISGIDDVLNSAVTDLSKASRWYIDFYDDGQSSSAISPVLDTLRYYDALKLRGWLRPERTATEGQHGTKSEVAEQADVGLAEGEQLHLDVVNVVNWHSVDRLLAWNFGDKARGKVRIEPTPLIDEKRAVYKFIFTALLANPGIIDLLASKLDLDAMAESLGIPTTDDINADTGGLNDPSDPFAELTTGGGIGANNPQQQQQQIAASRSLARRKKGRYARR